ncbi:MAG: hypothetical protein COZ50_11915 [Zetaproteobacteria bacterium CG_4_10_14_3_um_filter_54_28]|nr:MAG: hypothetical protein COZ50_11915 [Zetaproteobacteria bacterium CG_4_10_14_3_um_filter_54_28]
MLILSVAIAAALAKCSEEDDDEKTTVRTNPEIVMQQIIENGGILKNGFWMTAERCESDPEICGLPMNRF